jgi:hypothetical protein
MMFWNSLGAFFKPKSIQMFPMFFNTFGEDQNIINIHNSEIRKWVEDIIHDVLEFTRGILQTEKHSDVSNVL